MFLFLASCIFSRARVDPFFAEYSGVLCRPTRPVSSREVFSLSLSLSHFHCELSLPWSPWTLAPASSLGLAPSPIQVPSLTCILETQAVSRGSYKPFFLFPISQGSLSVTARSPESWETFLMCCFCFISCLRWVGKSVPVRSGHPKTGRSLPL